MAEPTLQQQAAARALAKRLTGYQIVSCGHALPIFQADAENIAAIAVQEFARGVEPEQRCRACRFWQVDLSRNGVGFCHRYPDHLHKSATDWCGEFEDPVL